MVLVLQPLRLSKTGHKVTLQPAGTRKITRVRVRGVIICEKNGQERDTKTERERQGVDIEE